MIVRCGNSQAIANKLQYKINTNLQAHSYPLFNGVAPRIITVLPVWLVEGRTTTISHRKSETRTEEVGVTDTETRDHMAISSKASSNPTTTTTATTTTTTAVFSRIQWGS
ncbi:uncharacterized protein LOC119771180 isoform X2 [Culex quinquefasciatus]|uniref:uncharacterized protein LOC119771180 isoform X2 n=1 Tax=Culex quinquefasciatus TaxID=7176 RepID=UPI0018E3B963|nr:uncharacterized protein LOC119771180 isoform X2 [Culex quinquefasciatus]